MSKDKSEIKLKSKKITIGLAKIETTTEELFKLLNEPFPKTAIKFRTTNYKKGNVNRDFLAYASARIYANRLNKVFGVGGWKFQYGTIDYTAEVSKGGKVTKKDLQAVKGILSVRIGEEWISYEETGSMTQMEPLKGGVSDSFKRCCVLIGIGAYLYNLPKVWFKSNNTYLSDEALKKLRSKLPAWACGNRDMFEWEEVELEDIHLDEDAEDEEETKKKSSKKSTKSTKKVKEPEDFEEEEDIEGEEEEEEETSKKTKKKKTSKAAKEVLRKIEKQAEEEAEEEDEEEDEVDEESLKDEIDRDLENEDLEDDEEEDDEEEDDEEEDDEEDDDEEDEDEDEDEDEGEEDNAFNLEIFQKDYDKRVKKFKKDKFEAIDIAEENADLTMQELELDKKKATALMKTLGLGKSFEDRAKWNTILNRVLQGKAQFDKKKSGYKVYEKVGKEKVYYDTI